MKYLLQERDVMRNGFTPWSTIRKEPGDEQGGARAEQWLREIPDAMAERRITRGEWILYRHQLTTE